MLFNSFSKQRLHAFTFDAIEAKFAHVLHLAVKELPPSRTAFDFLRSGWSIKLAKISAYTLTFVLRPP